MSTEAANLAAQTSARAPSRILAPAALVLAGALLFAVGFLVAYLIAHLPLTLVVALAFSALIPLAFQVLVEARVSRRAALLEAAATAGAHELTVRNGQLRLIGRLLDLLSRESRRSRIARAAIDFFIQEMDAVAAVYWKPNSDGEPEAASLGRSREPSAPGDLVPDEAQRVILARTAARISAPIVLVAGAGQPQPFDAASAPPAPSSLFLPLRGSEIGEGVMELVADGPWEPQRWEIMPALAAQVAAALERGRSYEEMRERADRDYVTGLYNHRFMQGYLQQLLATADSRGRSLALLLLDVDNFKHFNDAFGHSVGDRVLQIVADQLRLMADRVGAVGRFGGDEFIVTLPGHSKREAESFVQAFQDWLSNVGAPGGGHFPIRVSCGIAVFPYDAGRRQELLAVADARLYEAKRGNSARPVDRRRRGANGSPNLGVFGLLDRIVSSIDNVDHYTRAHCENTAEYAVMLSQEMGMSPSAQRTLRLAALLHDVGKIGIPDGILRKPGKLSPEEFAVIRHHVNIAGHLIVDIPNAEEVRILALHHHERWDGAGYPDGLKGEEIPYLARILAVADAFSALTLDRPHRRGLSHQEAYQELQRVAGTQLDPQLVKAFAPVLRRLVAGSARGDVAASVK
ncbi:MAG: diguanylate cyclase [Chloroflexi bacterium]|nr:diguanylate cyclase [Chloroflexota bacterium]